MEGFFLKYIWINPVVDRMYERFELNEILLRNGYRRVDCNIDWSKEVKEKYIKLLAKSDKSKTIIDMRCPTACKIPKSMNQNKDFIFPDIEPILIHCARELSARQDLLDQEKIITTPCKALAEMGNNLKLKNTQFFSWSDFIKASNIDIEIQNNILTPIPLGYFKSLGVNVGSISGEEEIVRYLELKNWESVRLLEMLYCDKGCHNGDGVMQNG